MVFTQVVLDGNDLKSLNVGWLRDNIGIVGQEPGQDRSEMEMMLFVFSSTGVSLFTNPKISVLRFKIFSVIPRYIPQKNFSAL